jgi:hypothetical protein
MNTYGNAALLNMQGQITNYDGGFDHLNQREGPGKATMANGNIYDGDWLNGLREGYGTLTYFSGDVYKGEFKNGFPNGRGQFVVNAPSAVGDVEKGSDHEGSGDDNDKPEREFDNTRHAQKVITGTFEQGKPSGCCVVSYPASGEP